MSKSRDIADSAATINYIDNVTSDVQSQINTLDTALDNISVTSGTLTKTFAQDESASISLTSSVLAPVVSVTKEVPQSGVTNNSWDVNSTTENYTRIDSAYATTLSFVGFDVSSASFVDSFSVSAQDLSPVSIAFNTDGTKMFILGYANDSVYEYNLSTGFDASTATYSQSLSVASQEAGPFGLAFNTDGTKMFIVGVSGKDVNEYTLSTGFNISTASFVDSFSVSAQSYYPTEIVFNNDGTKMFVLDATTDAVFEYTLSTAFDVSTASYSQNFSVASQDTAPYGLAFNIDGTKMFVVGQAGDDVNEYALSTGFDISTASFVSSFSVSAQDLSPTGIAFNAVGSKMFITGDAGDDVNEYTLESPLQLGTGSFASADVGKTIEANSGEFVLTATDGSYVETTAPTSYDQVASGSWSMYGVVYNAADGDLELSGYNNTFNIADAAYDSALFSVSAQMTNCYGVRFSSDGTKMYVAESTAEINQYNLSTPFVVTSAVYSSTYTSAESTTTFDFDFSSDGTKLYLVDYSSRIVYQYNLSTAWSISSASYSGKSFNASSFTSGASSISISTDGTKMFIGRIGTYVALHQISLSTAFDVSTASYDSVEFQPNQGNVYDYAFNADGSKLFAFSNTNQIIYQYSLGSSFNISSVTYDNVNFSVASQSLNAFYFCFNQSGYKLYISGTAADSIYQYSSGSIPIFVTGYQPVHTTTSIDSTYWTDINSMTADQNAGDGNVYYAISTDDRTTWTVIDNTDGERDIVRNNAGTWQYNSNATYALETWVNGTTNTELATLAEAMEGAVAGYGLANAIYDSVSFSVTAQETISTGLAFNTNGTKMFVLGDAGDDVNEYILSTAFDVSTATFLDSFSVSAQDGNPYGLTFNPDGTKMYIAGLVNDRIFQYTLSTGFDVSSASYSSISFSTVAQDATPLGIAFNTNGTKLFILGGATDSVYEYNLSTAYDVSTASFVDSFSLVSETTTAQDFVFNANGTSMFVIDNASDYVYEYTLSVGFDVSTASYSSVSFFVGSQETIPRSLSFGANGTKMFVLGSSTNTVYQYTTGLYTNQMDKTQLDAVTDPNHIALGNDLDLAIVFNMTSGTTVPSSDGVAINYDANVLNKGAVLGTDYDFDAPTQNSVRITALAANNLKVRVV